MTTYKKGEIAQMFMKTVHGEGWVKVKVLNQRENGQTQVLLQVDNQPLKLWLEQSEIKKGG